MKAGPLSVSLLQSSEVYDGAHNLHLPRFFTHWKEGLRMRQLAHISRLLRSFASERPLHVQWHLKWPLSITRHISVHSFCAFHSCGGDILLVAKASEVLNGFQLFVHQEFIRSPLHSFTLRQLWNRSSNCFLATVSGEQTKRLSTTS